MQTNLVGDKAKKALDEMENIMEKQKIENSPYFSPQEGKTYTLAFSGWTTMDKEFTKRDNSGNEVRDDDGQPVKETKRCLVLWANLIDGEDMSSSGPDKAPHPGKEWTITSKVLFSSMRIACENGNILKKKFQIRRTGKGFQTKYAVSEIGDR